MSTNDSARPIPVAICGASGYTGEELLRLCARHPGMGVRAVTSRSLAGQSIAWALPRLRGLLPDSLRFEDVGPSELASRQDIEAAFLALPHGAAAEYALPLVEAGKHVFDLSADFRLHDADLYTRAYGHRHPAPDWLHRAPYGLPEWAPEGWLESPLIAAPGCYPTSVLLPLLPLVRDGLVGEGVIVANCLSGVSGAGKKPEARLLFAECNENAVAYGLPRHRHAIEIAEQLERTAGREVALQFQPHLLPISRGILSTLTVPLRSDVAAGAVLDRVYRCWQSAYRGRRFIHLLEPGQFPGTAEVSRTNDCAFSAVVDEATRNLIVTSALDNLIKGAGGQALQAFNLAFGLPEEAGLVSA